MHAKDVVSILDALKKEEKIVLDGKLMDLYADWITEHPFDEGYGWGTVPWSKVEMPVSEKIIQEPVLERKSCRCIYRHRRENWEKQKEFWQDLQKSKILRQERNKCFPLWFRRNILHLMMIVG